MSRRSVSRRVWLQGASAALAAVALAACGQAVTPPAAAGMPVSSGPAVAVAPAASGAGAVQGGAAAAQVVQATVTTAAAAAEPVAQGVATLPGMNAAAVAAPISTTSVTSTVQAAMTEQAASTAETTAATATRAATATKVWPAKYSLGPLEHITQTYNNCGPASVAEVLNYWGVQRTQAQVQAILRADNNPAGMVPYGIPSYAKSLGFGHVVGTRGSDTLVKTLVSSGVPVVVNQWVSSSYHVGHYRPIQSYDDQQGIFVASDPFLGQNHEITYSEFDAIWQTNSQRFFLLYPAAKEALVQDALKAAGWDSVEAYTADLAKLQHRRDTGQPPRDGGSQYWAGHLALAMAWDYVAIGQPDKAREQLAAATVQNANSVVVGWIAGALATGKI